MAVSLPERTVDAWVAAYLAGRLSSVLLWAPTQLHHPDYDLAAGVPGPGKLFVLENKAPYAKNGHEFELPVRQMYNYLRHPTCLGRAATSSGLRANANRWLRRHARPGFLEDGRLRDVLGVAAEPWRAMVRRLSSAPELGAWTGEIWCRLVLEGSPARTVEDELWR